MAYTAGTYDGKATQLPTDQTRKVALGVIDGTDATVALRMDAEGNLKVSLDAAVDADIVVADIEAITGSGITKKNLYELFDMLSYYQEKISDNLDVVSGTGAVGLNTIESQLMVMLESAGVSVDPIVTCPDGLDLANSNGIVTLDGSGLGSITGLTSGDRVVIQGLDTPFQCDDGDSTPDDKAKWSAGQMVTVITRTTVIYLYGTVGGVVSWHKV